MNPLGPNELSLLAAVAFATSALTATVGLGGGIILLAVMLLYLEPIVAIPLHGVVQLVSNSSRTWIQREHVRWGILGWFALPLVPMGALGLLVAREIPVDASRFAIGVFVLLATWAPKLLFLGSHPENAHPTHRFLWLGAAVGFLNTTVGATGPLQAPFYRNLGLSRQGVVGTFAAAQSLGHAVKIALFVVSGAVFAPHALLLVLLSAGVVAGTWCGSRLLERVNERAFRILYRTALTLIALRLVVWGLIG